MSHFNISHLTLRTGTSSSLWATSNGKPANVFSKSFPRIFTPWAATTSLCFSYWFWKGEHTVGKSSHRCYSAIQSSSKEMLKSSPPTSAADRTTVKSSSSYLSVTFSTSQCWHPVYLNTLLPLNFFCYYCWDSGMGDKACSSRGTVQGTEEDQQLGHTRKLQAVIGSCSPKIHLSSNHRNPPCWWKSILLTWETYNVNTAV